MSATKHLVDLHAKTLFSTVLAGIIFGSVLSGVGSSIAFAATSTTTTQPATQQTIDEIVVQVPLPIMTLHNCKLHKNASGQPLTCVASYGEYIQLIYRYFSGIIGILAAIMLMWGGFRWIAAAGNTSRVESAKETIYSAIIALVIVLGSYTLLFSINPQLVNLTLYGVNPINPITQPLGLCSNNKPSLIDFSSGCNPSTEDCCGKMFNLNNQSEQCQWDTCPNIQEVCIGPNNTAPKCYTAKDYCESYTDSSSCPAADLVLQQAKQWNASEKKFTQKFTTTGCGLQNISAGSASLDFSRLAGKDRCIWNRLISAIPIDSTQYESPAVSCMTKGAQDVCWGIDSKTGRADLIYHLAQIADGPGFDSVREVCTDPDQKRVVAGTAAICLVKKGKLNSMDKKDYTFMKTGPDKSLTAPY